MDNIISENNVYFDIDYSNKKPIVNEFINCNFKNCNFEKSDLINISFMDCVFENCNISMAKLNNTSFKNIKFINCKMIGLDYTTCNKVLMALDFDKSMLDYSNFFRLNLKKTRFDDCVIKEANFTMADLTESIFNKCDLSRSVFSGTNLQGADFNTAFNYIIDPEQNRIGKAKFSLYGIVGLLDKYDIIIE
jgi:uncharacterized protein YjbI with pentapeptide repeats